MLEIKKRGLFGKKLLVLVFFLIVLFQAIHFILADPQGPDAVNISANETSSIPGSKMINISGGRVATMNLTSTVQDPRWKAFVGYVNGKFTLQDSSGSTIYDWQLTNSITGRVYSTRQSGVITWSAINCSNITTLNQENINMNETNPNDNLTKTFNYSAGATHSGFYVGARYMPANTCPTLNTYVGNFTQDTHFEENALYDGANIVYATTIENRVAGFDSNNYDFQMIVPENGAPGFTSATAYYLYLEIGT